MSQNEGRSPWFYVALGCGGLLLIAGGIFVAVVLIGVKAVKTAKEEMRNPEARHAKAVKVLGARELPDSYHAIVNFSVPVLLDIVVLGDRQALEGGHVDPATAHLFIYMEVFRGARDPDDIAAEKMQGMQMLEGQGIRLDSGEVLQEGDLTVGDQRILYSSHRGTVRVHGNQEMDGITSVLYIACPHDKRLRMGVWIGPDPQPEVADKELELAGTPADPEEIRAFMSQLDVCG